MSGRWLRKVARPRVLLPVLLAAALFVFALSLGNLGEVVARVRAVPVRAMLAVLGCAVLYLLVKLLQLHWLLRDLGARPARSRFVFAFAIGELALTFPLGVFAQNWVLAGGKGTRFGSSSAATVVMLVMEVVVALVWLAVCAIPGWPQVRWVAVALLVGLAGCAWAVFGWQLAQRLARRIRLRRLRRWLTESAAFLDGLRDLGRWRVLRYNLLITPVYLGALVAAFWIMSHAMAVPSLDYRQAATIYAFAMASVLVSGGLFGQIGTIEVLGMSVGRAFGLDYTDGLALMLGFRLAWTGSMWLLNGVLVAWLWRAVAVGGSRSRLDGGEETGR